ncbi:tetratricopeptide repeat protein [Wenjunlia tyrosinilytica]|uniref:Orc1-like AAA ATPase domain-containing protein n=1 Tax=Wenjunlia tyrosinilytica TaxID=1544741 RepID=A0A918DTA1_9ACTN|nr:tetratricopeptide repeat protein [Wenjunlia tyrosinilytica]GGO83022.1 hypothetical protein GCM10012280_10990 [Wenjunlia tyrosinilytica]
MSGRMVRVDAKKGARAGAPQLRDVDRVEFEQVVRRVAGDGARGDRVLEAGERIGSGAAAEYAEYLRAVRERRGRGGPPVRGAGLCAGLFGAAGFGLARVTVGGGGAAAAIGLFVVVAALATSFVTFPAKALARAALEREERRRRQWLAALEREARAVTQEYHESAEHAPGGAQVGGGAAAHENDAGGAGAGDTGAGSAVGAVSGAGAVNDPASPNAEAPVAIGGGPVGDRTPVTADPPTPTSAHVESALVRASARLPLQDGPFLGRDQALSAIARWADGPRPDGRGGPCVVVLHGPPGAGRTALAVRAAEMLRERFRVSCLVNLRGRPSDSATSPPETALSTRDALLHLLNRLGAPKQDLLFRDPASRDTHLRRLRQQYQEHVAALSTVLILDDAADAKQVRPLIPENSASLVLVTSREPLELTGLGNGIETHSVAVGPLGAPDADSLFDAIAGAGPHSAGDEALLRAAQGLPLAVCMAGAAVARGSIGSRLHGEAVPETVMGVSYLALDPAAARLFRRLVLVGRASLGPAAAAALLGEDESTAGARLAVLDRAHMVEQVHSGRYRLHDMLRGFARQCLEEEDDARERAAAQERLIKDYAELAESVIHRVEGASSSRSVRTVLRGAASPHGFETLDAALRWLDEESSFITATLRHTDDVDPQAVQRLVEALCDYCLLRGDLYRLGEIAELVQTLGRDSLIRSVKLRTGIAARQLGQLDRARTTLSSLVSMYREGHNEAGAARALCSLGITLHHRGNLPEAAAKLREALDLQRPDEQRGDRAWTLHALGAVLRDQGELDEAWELLHTARALHEETESLHGQAWTCLQLGQVHLRLGEVDEAEEQLWLSQELYRKTKDGRGEAWAMTQLGRTRLLRGEADAAVRELNEARGRHRRHEDARGEAWTLYYLGQALEDAGRLDRAEDALSRARHMFSTMGDRYGHACARHHFGRVARDRLAGRSGSLKNSGFARQLLHEARQDFRTVGLPHGEAWSCVELAVIDAGCGRIARAVDLLEDARELFGSLGDRSGGSWATFLYCTLLPLSSDDGGRVARETLDRLLNDTEAGVHPLARENALRWLESPWIDTQPDGPWPVWRQGLAPTRTARDVLGVTVRRTDSAA